MTPPRMRPVPTRDAIIRAVASSTAIETGKRISDLERKLRDHPPLQRERAPKR